MRWKRFERTYFTGQYYYQKKDMFGSIWTMAQEGRGLWTMSCNTKIGMHTAKSLDAMKAYAKNIIKEKP